MELRGRRPAARIHVSRSFRGARGQKREAAPARARPHLRRLGRGGTNGFALDVSRGAGHVHSSNQNVEKKWGAAIPKVAAWIRVEQIKSENVCVCVWRCRTSHARARAPKESVLINSRCQIAASLNEQISPTELVDKRTIYLHQRFKDVQNWFGFT